MIEIKKNLWDCDGPNVILCITTNGFVKNNGEAVMGRGCALEAAQRWPKLPAQLGEALSTFCDNRPLIWTEPTFINDLQGFLGTFPVKYNWWEKADLDLIKRSAEDMASMLKTYDEFDDLPDIEKVYIPRPGCGNGKLDWETEVKPLLEAILTDNRFVIVDFPND